MKKTILLSFVFLTIALTVGCSNGLPRSCFMRKWFCGKECEPAVTCYAPAEGCSTCPTCPGSSGVIVGDPVITSDGGCSSCNTAPALPIDSGSTVSGSPQGYSYNK